MGFRHPTKKSSLLVLKRFNIDHFSRSHGSPFSRQFAMYSGRNGALDKFPHRQDVSLGLSQDGVNDFLACNIQFFSTRAQNVQYWPFFKVARVAIFAAICYVFGTKRRSRQVSTSPRCFPRSIIGRREWFSCLKYIIHLNSCSKGSILTIFRGLTDRHLRDILSFFRDKRVLQTYLRTATMCPWV